MIHIQRFIEKLQGFEARGSKDYIMPIKDAKDLHADITKLLLAMQSLREQKVDQPQTVSIEMTGGSF